MQTILGKKVRHYLYVTLPCQKKLPGAPMNRRCPSWKNKIQYILLIIVEAGTKRRFRHIFEGLTKEKDEELENIGTNSQHWNKDILNEETRSKKSILKIQRNFCFV